MLWHHHSLMSEACIFCKPATHLLRNLYTYICVFVYTHVCAQLCLTLQSHELQPARLLCPWDFPGKDTGVGCHFWLQGIFLTQGSKPCLLHLLNWQVDSLPLCHLGSPIYTYIDIDIDIDIDIHTHTHTHIRVHAQKISQQNQFIQTSQKQQLSAKSKMHKQIYNGILYISNNECTITIFESMV